MGDGGREGGTCVGNKEVGAGEEGLAEEPYLHMWADLKGGEWEEK